MKNVLYIILISIFSLTVISCSSSSDGGSSTTSTTTTDTTAPVIAEVTVVTTPTSETLHLITPFHLMRQVLSPMEVPVLQVPLLQPLATIQSL